eukprot:3991023-Amphidinium_carterae.1
MRRIKVVASTATVHQGSNSTLIGLSASSLLSSSRISAAVLPLLLFQESVNVLGIFQPRATFSFLVLDTALQA